MSTCWERNDSPSLEFNFSYDAPASLVFDTWTNPNHLARWWGPNEFKTITHEMTVEVGGVWHYTMVAPDGSAYPSKAVYTIVDRPRRLSFSNTGGDPVHQHLTCEFTADFKESNGRTRLILRMKFKTQQALELARKFGAERGGHEALERLALAIDAKQHHATTTSHDNNMRNEL